MENKQALVYLLSFLALFISLFCFYRFWVISPELEDSSQNQSLFSKDKKSPENLDSSHSTNRHGDSQEKARNEKIRNLTQTSVTPVFETFDLSPKEVELFHGRRYEPREATLFISGLRIDRNAFKIEKKEDLPPELIVPLPGGEGKREFVRTFVDFQNKDIFVWVGTAKDNKLDTFHLSVYQGVMIGSIETSKGSYEIKQLTKSKNTIRKIDRNIFPENNNDAVSKNSKDERSLKPRLEEDGPSPEIQALNSGGVYIRSNVQVDIVLGFSHLIKNSEGSFRAAMALMNQFVSVANTTHRNSRTGVVINVRAIMELNVSSLSELGDNLSLMDRAYSFETGGAGFNRNNPYHFLAYKRYQTSSDLKVLITERYTSACGIAYLPIPERQKRLSSVTSANCSHEILTHEIGHNMGAAHARDQFSSSQIAYLTGRGIYPYAYGFRSPGRVRTVMAYNCEDGCPKVPYFSGPNHSYSPGGKTLYLGLANKMDNSRAIRRRSGETSRISTLRPGLGLQMPRITGQSGGTFSSGSLTLRVIAMDPNSPRLSLSYQWYRDGRALSGQNRKSLVLRRPSNGGTVSRYYVRVTNSVGSVYSSYRTVDLRSPPRITRQPVGGILSSGSLTLRVTAMDPNSPRLSLSYQWYRDGRALSGTVKGTNRLVLQPSSQSGIHKYYVMVSNAVGHTKSAEVTVFSLKSPRIVKQPRGGIINSKLGLFLEVEAVNPNPAPHNGALSYQWYQNGSPINNEEGRKSGFLVTLNNFVFQPTYYVKVSYKGKVTQSEVVKVEFEMRLRNSKWEGLLDPATDPSLIEIGQIDRSLDLKKSIEEVEEEGVIMRGIANEE